MTDAAYGYFDQHLSLAGLRRIHIDQLQRLRVLGKRCCLGQNQSLHRPTVAQTTVIVKAAYIDQEMQRLPAHLPHPSATSCLTAIIILCTGTLSCVSNSVELNSERIARIFGNYHIEVIENNKDIRVSNLYSLEPTGAVCRTFAVIGLTDDVDALFASEHAEILEGGSIGAVFRRNGWRIEKRHLYIGVMPIGRQAVRLTRLMRIEPPVATAVHIYGLAISKNGRSFDYAMIAEVHHPDYMTIAVLWSLYGSEYSGDISHKDARPLLELVRAKFRDASYSG